MIPDFVRFTHYFITDYASKTTGSTFISLCGVECSSKPYSTKTSTCNSAPKSPLLKSKRISEIILIGDVITSGDHFKACQQMIKNNCPEVAVIGIFWARSIRDGWYDLRSEYSIKLMKYHSLLV